MSIKKRAKVFIQRTADVLGRKLRSAISMRIGDWSGALGRRGSIVIVIYLAPELEPPFFIFLTQKKVISKREDYSQIEDAFSS